MTSTPLAQVKRTLADLLPRYMHNRRSDVVVAREALARSDFDAVRRIGHRLKGSGAGYGFDTITVLGGQLEQACIRHDSREASGLIDALDGYLRDVRIEIV